MIPSNGLRHLYPVVDPRVSAILWHGRGAASQPFANLQDVTWTLVQQRLASLALSYVREHGIELGGEELKTLNRFSFWWSSVSVQAVERFKQLSPLLDDAGIPFVVFKGPTIARHYSKSHLRPFGDVDVLVSPHRFREAQAVLHRNGLAERDLTRTPYRFMQLACREAQNLRGPGGASIDLHHTLPPWLWARDATRGLLHASTHAVRDSTWDAVLASAEWNLLVASLHLMSDRSKPGQTLIIWRDLVELADKVDADVFAAIASESRLAGWVRYTLNQIPEEHRPHEVIAALPQQRIRHAVRLSLLASPKLVGSRVPVSQMFRLPVGRAAAFAAGTAAPPPNFVRERYERGTIGSYMQYFSAGERHVGSEASGT